ncbi:MAG: nucleoside transporter C-terminal domain-containing protein [Verrucomicrobiota bacterium]
MDLYNLVSFGGLFVLIFIAWALSTHRKSFNVRCVVWGTILQLVFGAFVFLAPLGTKIFLGLSKLVVKLLSASADGAAFCFGPLAIPPGKPGHLGFILVCQGLPAIIFFASLMGVLYYVRLMPLLIKGFAWVFTKLMRVSGAESLVAAANIFVGIESATTVLPYLNNMTRSEIHTVLVAGFATIASSVLGVYVMMLQDHFPSIAGHLISASVLSAPAALVMSKLMLPETDQPETLGRVVEPHYQRESNIIEAAINGATAGGKMIMGVIVMLMAFLGLLALVNMGLDGAAKVIVWFHGPSLNLRLDNLLAYVYYPFAIIMGVPPPDAFEVARLLGIRTVATEIPAYLQLNQLLVNGGLQYGRSAVLASYALCGFSHIPSIAIFVGGIAALAPRQTQTLSRVAFRALVAATLACFMTAAIAGTFYGKGALLLQIR